MMRHTLLTRPLTTASAMLIRGALRCKFDLILLICCIFVHPAHGASIDVVNSPKSPLEQKGLADDARTQEEVIYQTWTSMYGLDPAIPLPPLALSSLPGSFPPLAPHLLDCSLEAAKVKAADTLGSNGELPEWWGDGGGPQPPWVRGGDEDNLPLTRRAQADIWRLHHPVDCNETGVRFMYIGWADPQGHGIGSQLHLMTSAMSKAVKYGRILVVSPGSFYRADHAGCKGKDRGSLNCYFESLAKPECLVRVEELMALKSGVTFIESSTRDEEESLASATPLLVYHKHCDTKYESDAALLWGTPWRTGPETTDLFGTMMERRELDDRLAKTQWWRAQAIRYMLRWPTPYLCHITNKVRHVTMGKLVASRVAMAKRGQNRAIESKALKLNALVNQSTHSKFERSLKGSPYMPRPIVSIHVRQGDKAREMRLFSFEAHMWMAERLRFHVPNLENVWLSTEMESVVNKANEHYSEWRFFYTHNARQVGGTAMIDYETSVGKQGLVETSLANLLISAECDYFIGTLGSNWNRLINELRLTNGRLRAGYITLNYDEH